MPTVTKPNQKLRGRPKGSKNAVKPIKAVVDGVKSGRGRPKGSINEAKIVAEDINAVELLHTYKSKAGKCACVKETSITPSFYTMVVCEHHNELDYVSSRRKRQKP